MLSRTDGRLPKFASPALEPRLGTDAAQLFRERGEVTANRWKMNMDFSLLFQEPPPPPTSPASLINIE